MAGKLGSLYFAAGERHGLENLLVAEGRFLIGFLGRAAALTCVLFVRIPVLISHKKRTALTQTAESAIWSALHCEPLLFRSVLQEKDSADCHCWYTRAGACGFCPAALKK